MAIIHYIDQSQHHYYNGREQHSRFYYTHCISSLILTMSLSYISVFLRVFQSVFEIIFRYMFDNFFKHPVAPKNVPRNCRRVLYLSDLESREKNRSAKNSTKKAVVPPFRLVKSQEKQQLTMQWLRGLLRRKMRILVLHDRVKNFGNTSVFGKKFETSPSVPQRKDSLRKKARWIT